VGLEQCLGLSGIQGLGGVAFGAMVASAAFAFVAIQVLEAANVGLAAIGHPV
jgi:hypothetical protein